MSAASLPPQTRSTSFSVKSRTLILLLSKMVACQMAKPDQNTMRIGTTLPSIEGDDVGGNPNMRRKSDTRACGYQNEYLTDGGPQCPRRMSNRLRPTLCPNSDRPRQGSGLGAHIALSAKSRPLALPVFQGRNRERALFQGASKARFLKALCPDHAHRSASAAGSVASSSRSISITTCLTDTKLSGVTEIESMPCSTRNRANSG